MVDLEDPVHRGEGDRQAALDAGRAARQAGAGAARDDRDAELGGEPDELGDLGGRRREDDGPRQAGLEVGRLVEAVATRGRSGRSGAARPGSRARDRARRAVVRRRSAVAAVASSGRWSSRPKSTRPSRTPRRTMGDGTTPPPSSAARHRRGRRRSAAARPRASSSVTPRPSPRRRSPVPRDAAGARHRARARSTDRARCSTRPTTPTLRLSLGHAQDLRSTRPRRSATPRAAPIDRVELNTIAARLGGMPLERGHGRRRAVARDASATRRSSCRSAASCRSAPRRTVQVRYRATLRSSADRLELAVHEGERDHRPVPLAAVGQPRASPSTGRTTATRSRRRSSRVGPGPDRDRPEAGPRDDRRPGLGQRRRPDPDLRGHATSATSRSPRPPTTGRRRGSSRDSVVRVYYRPGAPGAAMLDAAADAFDALERAARVVPASDVPGRPVGRRLRDGVARARSGSRPASAASNLRYLAAHETAHQWFYGLVGNDQATRAVRRRGRRRLRGPLRPRPAARRAAAPRPRSTGRSTRTRAACYYEKIYIQGGNLLDDARRRMGSTAFWAALRGVRRGQPVRARRRPRRCSTRSTRDVARPRARRSFGPRFPRHLLSAIDVAPSERRRSAPARPVPATRRSAASAFGICRNPAGSSGRQARQPATSQRRHRPLARTPRAARTPRGRTAAAARPTATASRRRPPAGMRRGRRPPAGRDGSESPAARAAAAARPRRARARPATTRTGPSGAEHRRDVRARTPRGPPAARPRARRTPARSAASRRRTPRGASRDSGSSQAS